MRPLACWLGSLVLLPSLALATVPIDDCEDVSDWSGMTLEKTQVKVGTGAARWENHVQKTSARKVFAAPLDASQATNLDCWVYSGKANGAGIELVLDSENAATTGPDYYSWHLVVDWTGWKRLRLPRSKAAVAREPLGWNQLKAITFNASGWGNTPQADTLLILDALAFDGGPVLSATGTSSWSGADYVYSFDVMLENGAAQSRTFALSLEGGVGHPFTLAVSPSAQTLSAGARSTVQATMTIPASFLTPANALSGRSAMFTVREAGQEIDVQELRAVAPFPKRSRPHSLLDAADLTRINTWAAEEAWAKKAKDSLVATANAWPGSFQTRYGIPAWKVPDEGGQWGLWYVCPDHGVYLEYTPPMTHTCPADKKVWTGWPYDQVIYARMHDDLAVRARQLGLVYRLDGDQAKAEAALAILKAYADRYLSFPVHDVNGKSSSSGGRVLAQTLDEAVWAVSIAWAYDLVADAPGVDAATRAHLENDLLRPLAATIAKNRAGMSNWQSWHNAALAAVGFAIDDPALLSLALDDPQHGFLFQMQKSIPGDGIWYEGSWGYHFFALDPLAKTANMFQRAGRDLFAQPPLRAMFESPLNFAQPDLSLPAFNDDGGSSLKKSAALFEIGYAQYRTPELASPLDPGSRSETSLLFGARTLPDAPPMPSASALYADSGFAVLRSGQGLAANYLAMKFGAHGGWHGHFDKLGMVLFGRGTVLGVDPGTQSYAASTHTTWDKVTVAHNTVVVDGETQAEATGALRRFVALPGASMVAADGGAAYANASLLRTLVLAGEYAVDRFRVRATDGKSHTVDWAYHDYGALQTSLATTAYSGLPATNGYQHVTSPKAAVTDAAWDARFQVSDGTARAFGSTWPSDPSVTASFQQTTERAAGGSWSGKLAYSFTKASTYVLYTIPLEDPPAEAPTAVKLQVYGDGSKHKLTLRLMDATGERWVKAVGSVDWTGWKQVEVADVGSWSHYLGDEDGVFDPPAASVIVQLDAPATGTSSGALFVDDVRVVFAGAGDKLVEDFELPAQALALRMLGATGTTVVEAKGLGPKILQPVPMLLVRRQTADTTFVASLEPMGDAPVVTALAALSTSASVADEALAVAASGPKFSDELLALAAGAGGTSRTFGTSVCDGTLCLVRRAPGGALSRVALAEGATLSSKEGPVLTAKRELAGLQLDWSGSALALTSSGSTGELRVWAPEAQSVTVGGKPVTFVRDGDYVVLEGAVAGPDAGRPGPDAAGVEEDAALSDASVSGGSDAAGATLDAASEPDAGGASPQPAATSGCGCQAGAGLSPLASLLLLGFRRRRR